MQMRLQQTRGRPIIPTARLAARRTNDMAVQFAGSSSTGNRRRRRLAVNGDGATIDATHLEGDGSEMESQLVASEAAGPWVPVTELRIWIYSTVIALLLGAVTFAVCRPDLFTAEIKPLTDLLFSGPAPAAIVSTKVLFLGLSAQMAMLIGWYRSRCMLDFGGRYRVWPWAVGLFGLAATCAATNAHHALGQIFGHVDWLTWRGETVVWLLPTCLFSLPISLFLDRDLRNSRSSLYMLRSSIALWLASAYFQVYRPELQSLSWFPLACLVIPVFASATLFIGLWLHVRVVAYVCPDPPELDQRSAWSLAVTACGVLVSAMMFWKRRAVDVEDEEESKPKRRRKKATTEETPAKRKRKPAKRMTSRTKTRVKSTEEEEEEEVADDSNKAANDEELTSYDGSPSYEEAEIPVSDSDSSDEENQAQWDEEEPPAPPVAKGKGNGRITQTHQAHESSPRASHARWDAVTNDENESGDESATVQEHVSSETEDDDRQYPGEPELTADQMRGLSKRQKRELKKQLRERSRG